MTTSAEQNKKLVKLDPQSTTPDPVFEFLKKGKVAFKGEPFIQRLDGFASSHIERVYFSSEKECVFVGFDNPPRELWIYNQFTLQEVLNLIQPDVSLGKWIHTIKHKCLGSIKI